MCPLQTAEEMQEEPTGEDVHEEQKCLVAWEALRLYRVNNEAIRPVMNVSTGTCFANHATRTMQ